jgi:hypothetical protein
MSSDVRKAPRRGEKSHALFLSHEKTNIEQSYSRRKVLKFAIRLNNNNSSGWLSEWACVADSFRFRKRGRERERKKNLPHTIATPKNESQTGEGAEPTVLERRAERFPVVVESQKPECSRNKSAENAARIVQIDNLHKFCVFLHEKFNLNKNYYSRPSRASSGLVLVLGPGRAKKREARQSQSAQNI